MVGQSHDSFALVNVVDVMFFFQDCQQAIEVMCTGHTQEAL
jgi:hypothetical protein